jgi:hypothetical protein
MSWPGRGTDPNKHGLADIVVLELRVHVKTNHGRWDYGVEANDFGRRVQLPSDLS